MPDGIYFYHNIFEENISQAKPISHAVRRISQCGEHMPMLTTLKLSDNGAFISGGGQTCDALEHPGKVVDAGKT